MLTVIPGSLGNETTISIGDIQDATIYQNNPNNSSGQGPGLFSGTNGMDSPRRGLLQFDIADNIPHGATITGVQLTLVLGQIAGAGMGGGGGTSTIQLHDLTDSWGYPQPQLPPSDNLGGTGQGIPAMTGDVTWDTRFFNESPALPWSSPGGDFWVIDASLPVTGPLNTSWVWSSPTMVNDVQGWLNDPSTDFGWILVNADEVDPTDFRAFYSRNALTPSNQPLLTITYIPADSPPVVQLNAPNANYETTWNNSGAVAIASSANASVTDAESSTLNAMTITLASPQPGDVLSATPTGSVTVTAYNAGTGVLTLSGSDTLAHYQQVLGTVKYNNTTGSPNIAAETVSVVATDSLNSSTAAVATININVTSHGLVGLGGQAVLRQFEVQQERRRGRLPAPPTTRRSTPRRRPTCPAPGRPTSPTSVPTPMASTASWSTWPRAARMAISTPATSRSASALTTRPACGPLPQRRRRFRCAPAAGTGGGDRVELTWTDGSITEEFLEVTVHADPNTGLSAPYTFFYGSVIANTGTGDTGALAITSSTDENAARSHSGTATVTNIYDFNKDGFVNSSDENAARGNGATIKFIKIAANTPLAPDASPSVAPDLSVAPAVTACPGEHGSGGDTGLASGLTSLLNSLKTGTLPPLRLDWLASRLENVNLNSGVAATIFEALAAADTKLTRSILVGSRQGRRRTGARRCPARFDPGRPRIEVKVLAGSQGIRPLDGLTQPGPRGNELHAGPGSLHAGARFWPSTAALTSAALLTRRVASGQSSDRAIEC